MRLFRNKNDMRSKKDYLRLVTRLYADWDKFGYCDDLTNGIIAYKYVRKDRTSPVFNGEEPYSTPTETIVYKDDTIIQVVNCNYNAAVECGAGINLATLEWVNDHIENGISNAHGCIRIALKFTTFNIAALPFKASGKFRVWSALVIGEVDSKGRLIKRIDCKEPEMPL